MSEHDEQAQSREEHEKTIPEVGGDEQGEWQSDVNDQRELGDEDEDAEEIGSTPQVPGAETI